MPVGTNLLFVARSVLASVWVLSAAPQARAQEWPSPAGNEPTGSSSCAISDSDCGSCRITCSSGEIATCFAGVKDCKTNPGACRCIEAVRCVCGGDEPGEGLRKTVIESQQYWELQENP